MMGGREEGRKQGCEPETGKRLRDTEIREAGRDLAGRAERDKGWGRQHRRQTGGHAGETLKGSEGETHTDVMGRETLRH